MESYITVKNENNEKFIDSNNKDNKYFGTQFL